MIVVSLVLMLARMRTKAFPMALSILEIILRTHRQLSTHRLISDHLQRLLRELVARESENAYLISWIVYFMRTNGMDGAVGAHQFKNVVSRAVYTSRFTEFRRCSEFKVFEGVKSASKRISMHRHVRMFP